MRNYTSRKEKADKYAKKYNLSEEYVKEILSTPDYELSKEQLRVKYNNEDIGKIPDWMTEEDLIKMLAKTTRRYV